MWRPLMPVLAQRFTVIAPDLPGSGDIPSGEVDMTTVASRIHTLASRSEPTGRESSDTISASWWRMRTPRSSRPTWTGSSSWTPSCPVSATGNDFAADPARSIPDADRAIYTAAYARPGRMRAGWAYFASFPKTASDFRGCPRGR